MGIITDHRTLRGMEIAGYIRRNGSSGSQERHWTGQSVKVCHVAEGPKLAKWWGSPFKYRGKEYQLKYFDGCFHPFVVEVGKPTPRFV